MVLLVIQVVLVLVTVAPSGCLHGRNAGYPAPPVQTPACSFSAPGSSVLLASAQDLAIKQTLSVAASR